MFQEIPVEAFLLLEAQHPKPGGAPPHGQAPEIGGPAAFFRACVAHNALQDGENARDGCRCEGFIFFTAFKKALSEGNHPFSCDFLNRDSFKFREKMKLQNIMIASVGRAF